MDGNLGRGPGAVKAAPAIVLTTDFGLDDPYVGIVKGVLLGLAPGVPVLDLTHGIPPQGALEACLALEAARPYFPLGSLHVVVVDPGVGTARRALAAFTARDAWVFPDNGVLSFLPAAEIQELRVVENASLFLQPVSRTFHGRDVFAPVAARLATGLPRKDLGPRTPDMRRLEMPRARLAAGAAVGEVLAFDRFGNALTSIRSSDLPPGELRIWVQGREIPWAGAYADVPAGEPLGLIGSSGRLEVCVREGSARASLRLGRGDEIRVRARRPDAPAGACVVGHVRS